MCIIFFCFVVDFYSMSLFDKPVPDSVQRSVSISGLIVWFSVLGKRERAIGRNRIDGISDLSAEGIVKKISLIIINLQQNK